VKPGLKEIKKRLVNAYLRGFRRAVTGGAPTVDVTDGVQSAYAEGYRHGQRTLGEASTMAERYAQKIFGSEP